MISGDELSFGSCWSDQHEVQGDNNKVAHSDEERLDSIQEDKWMNRFIDEGKPFMTWRQVKNTVGKVDAVMSAQEMASWM